MPAGGIGLAIAREVARAGTRTILSARSLPALEKAKRVAMRCSNPNCRQVPVAVVVRKPGWSLTCDALLQFLEGRLGKFKLPRVVEFSVEPLPKTGTGKIRKLLLREKFWAGKEKRVQG